MNSKYYQTIKYPSFLFVFLILFFSTFHSAFAQNEQIDVPQTLPNGKCQDAKTLNPVQISDCSTNEIQFNDFEGNARDITPSCIEFENYGFFDVFYEVMIPESGSLYLRIEEGYYIYAAIYDACNGTELFCGQIIDDNFDDNLRIDNLSPGETIILQLFTQYDSGFSFCLIEPLVSINNECDEALPLVINSGGECEKKITANLLLDYYTKISSCNYSVARNVFYKFNTPATGKVRIKRLSSSFGVAIYNSSCDGEEIYCSEYLSDSTIDELTPGNEYILEVFSNSADDVVFCVEDGIPTQNNMCSDAIPITVLDEDECTNENLIEVDIFNNNYNIVPNCEFSIYRDLFYSFEVPLSGQVKINTSERRIGCAIYDSCNGNSLFCEDDGIQGLIAKGLPAGENVIVQFLKIALAASEILISVFQNLLHQLMIFAKMQK